MRAVDGKQEINLEWPYSVAGLPSTPFHPPASMNLVRRSALNIRVSVHGSVARWKCMAHDQL